jgi:hypothetical protein
MKVYPAFTPLLVDLMTVSEIVACLHQLFPRSPLKEVSDGPEA